jgi:hypothetical protein
MKEGKIIYSLQNRLVGRVARDVYNKQKVKLLHEMLKYRWI